MNRQSLSSILLAVSLTGLTGLAGCVSPSTTPPKGPGVISSNAGGLISNSGEGKISNNAGGLIFEGGSGKAKPGTAGGAMASAGAMPAMAPGAASDAAVVSNGSGLVMEGGESMPAEQQQDALKAGAIDDNAKFEDYLAYRVAYAAAPMRVLDISERHVIKVLDADGKLVSNADVTVSVNDLALFKGKSYANGELLFHPKATAGAEQAERFDVSASRAGFTQTASFARNQEGAWELKLTAAIAKPKAKLDVLFLIDATGSMGGEIARLQDTIKTVSSRIQGLEAQPTVRYSLVAYRDQGEEYVTAAADFTASVTDFKASLDKVEASGGGDKAEDVESGLAKAVSGVSWGEDAVRLVFLVADAAPHIDYQQNTPYTSSVKKAAEFGIKLFPIGCSSLEPEGEYAFRQLAQYTMGQYLFITRGGDEATAGAASATVDKFQEGRLDDIVVDIVKAELGQLGQ